MILTLISSAYVGAEDQEPSPSLQGVLNFHVFGKELLPVHYPFMAISFSIQGV